MFGGGCGFVEGFEEWYRVGVKIGMKVFEWGEM